MRTSQPCFGVSVAAAWCGYCGRSFLGVGLAALAGLLRPETE
jgi:hypothetical protein